MHTVILYFLHTFAMMTRPNNLCLTTHNNTLSQSSPGSFQKMLRIILKMLWLVYTRSTVVVIGWITSDRRNRMHNSKHKYTDSKYYSAHFCITKGVENIMLYMHYSMIKQTRPYQPKLHRPWSVTYLLLQTRHTDMIYCNM